MAQLRIPDRSEVVLDHTSIQRFLAMRGIFYDRWTPAATLEAVAQPREQGAEEHQGSPRHVERGGAYLAVSEDRSGPGNAAIGVVQQLLSPQATQDEVLAAFSAQLGPFMKDGGYTHADVISVYPETPNLSEIRQKFLREHTHTEDEIRYFVEGSGLFWFHCEDGAPVFNVLCQAGDLLSVPKGMKHWFDLGSTPHVRAIRIFQDPAGWIAHYTDSGIDARYNPVYVTTQTS